MLGILTDDSDYTLALDDFALLAHGLNRGSDLHLYSFPARFLAHSNIHGHRATIPHSNTGSE